MNHTTFEEFKADWRKNEMTNGTKLKATCICGQHVIAPEEPLTDEQLREIWDIATQEQATGLNYAGTIIGEDNGALTLKDVGK